MAVDSIFDLYRLKYYKDSNILMYHDIFIFVPLNRIYVIKSVLDRKSETKTKACDV